MVCSRHRRPFVLGDEKWHDTPPLGPRIKEHVVCRARVPHMHCLPRSRSPNGPQGEGSSSGGKKRPLWSTQSLQALVLAGTLAHSLSTMALPSLTPNAITDIDKEVKVNEPILQLLVCALSLAFLNLFSSPSHSHTFPPRPGFQEDRLCTECRPLQARPIPV